VIKRGREILRVIPILGTTQIVPGTVTRAAPETPRAVVVVGREILRVILTLETTRIVLGTATTVAVVDVRVTRRIVTPPRRAIPRATRTPATTQIVLAIVT
jgi:hypothetical protein